MSPVLFLDFDGVTHPDVCRNEELFRQIPLIEDVLLRHPRVQVVISSSWRENHSLDGLRTHFCKELRERVVGFTPILDRFNRDVFRDMHDAPHLNDAYRQAEIEAWMHLNRPKGTAWLAIDDRHWWFEPGCKNLLITHPRLGFTEVDALELDDRLLRLGCAAAQERSCATVQLPSVPQEEPPELLASLPEPLTPGQLKTLYPYQFSGPGVRWMSFARGWMPPIVDMCHEVDALLRGRFERYAFEWVDFKEKFGIGRFQYRLVVLADPDGDGPDSAETTYVKKALLDIKLRAEVRTKSLCMVCGQPGALVDASWKLTLCPDHEASLQRKEPLNAWLADDGSELKVP